MAETSCSDSDLEVGVGKSGKDNQKELLLAASTALQNNSPFEAVEKFKLVLDKMEKICKSSQKIPIPQLIIHYTLCIALIKCSDYKHLVEAVDYLRDLMDCGYASKLPALYLAFAKAYYALNRFKKALDYIEKGLKVIQSNTKVKQHIWPGLQQPIEETKKDVLQKELLSLQKDCKSCGLPNAICEYDRCLDISNHVSPSRDIYFLDPDFKPFLYVRCDSECNFAYHELCWKHLTLVDRDLREPQDLLGTPCSSEKCVSNGCVITEVLQIGRDGFNKPLTIFSEKPSHKSNNISQIVSANGPTTNPSENASLREWKSDSSSSVKAASLKGAPIVKLSPVEDMSVQKKISESVPSFPCQYLSSQHRLQVPLGQLTSFGPRTFMHYPPMYPYVIRQPQSFFAYTSVPPQTMPYRAPTKVSTLLKDTSVELSRVKNSEVEEFKRNVRKRAEEPPMLPLQLQSKDIRTQIGVASMMPVQPPVTSVEVCVHKTGVLTAGSTFLVPIGPNGGPVLFKPPNPTPIRHPTQAILPNVTQSPLKLKRDSLDTPPIKCVVEEFKKIVKKLAGESCSESSQLPAKTPSSSCNSVDYTGVSMKQVVAEFKKLVHDRAGSAVSRTDGSKSSEGSDLPKKNPFPTFGTMTNRQDTASLSYSASHSSHLCSLVPIPSSDTTISSSNNNMLHSMSSHNHILTQSCTFQDKSHPKKVQCHSQVVISPTLINSCCSSQEDIGTQPVLERQTMQSLLEALNECRAKKFGYSDEDYVNPELQRFGHPYAEFSTHVEADESFDEGHAEFVFTYFHEMFDKNGIHRIEDLQETWASTISDVLGLPKEFTDKYTSASEFLLRSDRFAAIDDDIGTSDLLPRMFSKADNEITESVSYLLFSQVSNSQIIDHSTHNAWKNKVNNNSCDSADMDGQGSYPSKTDSDGIDKSEGKDSNHNPIQKLSIPNGKTSKPTSEHFSPKIRNILTKEVVYMSDDDEDIDSSLIEIDDLIRTDSSMSQAGNEVIDPSERSRVTHKCCEGIMKPDVLDQDTQTDEVIDSERKKLIEDNTLLLKGVQDLKYEKAELHQRIKLLENINASRELEIASTIKQLQESHEEELKQKTEEFKEVCEKNSTLDEELKKLKELLEKKDSQISQLDASVNKLHRSHAKEINNLEILITKRLQEEKLAKEKEFHALLNYKDQMLMKLWKDFSEYKINKFNNLCNERIIILSQLKEIMSDSLHPTKSDLKSSIEKYEEEMISVALRNNEVNKIYNQEMERLRNGEQIQPHSVIDLPDFKKLPYPLEGALQYVNSLVKPKQDEYAVSRNPFSRFYPKTFPSNGLQPLSQPRENEGSPSISNSIFGTVQNETSHLWNNSFYTPTVTPSPLSFDVTNTNAPPLSPQQGFGTSNMMQPPLSLMSSMMSFQPKQASQISSVQLIGQNRSTLSPLRFTPSNGSTFDANAASLGVIGSKAPMPGAVQSSVAIPAPSNTVVKNSTGVVSAGASIPVNSQGAVPKPRFQTATAAMTPIVPSKPVVRTGLKGPKSNESNYEKLMRNLQKMFPTRNDTELQAALKMVRYRNGNTLSSLTHSEIVAKVEEILNKQAKQTSMGWEKFGQAAWGTTKVPVSHEWQGSEQDECCICMTAMSIKEVYALECKHDFHKDCIRKWLEQDALCPICRTHSIMKDEFPPLG